MRKISLGMRQCIVSVLLILSTVFAAASFDLWMKDGLTFDAIAVGAICVVMLCTAIVALRNMNLAPRS